MATSPEARSIGELLRDLSSDSASLVQQEFALARAEAEAKLHQMIMASIELLVGALVAFAALIILLDAVVYSLAEAGLQRWLAALIVGGVVAVIGFLLVRKDLVARIGAAGLGEHRRHKKPAPARQARCVCNS